MPFPFPDTGAFWVIGGAGRGWVRVTVSIRRMSLGAGFEYLVRSVARGDGAAPGSTSLTRYYAQSGTPAGWWLGSGLAGLADGQGVAARSEVTEEGLWQLLGMLSDPVTGKPLGHRPRRPPAPLGQRIVARVGELPAGLLAVDRAAAVARIEAEEKSRESSMARTVAGFDLTFSVPKSASVVWALADPQMQAAIHRAHRDAIGIAMRWAEQQVVFTRTGHDGAIQEPVRGVVAAAFDHWDSRAGDPHLHTHVVVANRVQTLDGRWRTLDSKTLHRYAVALSELHEGIVQDLLTERFGHAWTSRPRRHSPVPRWDIDGVPVELMETFSQRAAQIATGTDDLVAGFAATHGRHPSSVELQRLRQQATLATRPGKTHHSLHELSDLWRRRAAGTVDPGAAPNVRALGSAALPVQTTVPLDHQEVEPLAREVLEAVSTKRATFGHANLLAETHRRLHGRQFTSTEERLRAADAIVTRALNDALQLNPPSSAATELRIHKGADRFTTRAIFDAETRLLDAGRDTAGPALPIVEITALETASTVRLGADQVAAVLDVATSGRRLDLLIGPAGTGKTTSLHALRQAWENHHGAGSVVGLAPSAVAADVLADQLGIAAENTTKWLLEHDRTPERDQHLAHLQRQLDACSSRSTVHAQRLTRLLDTATSQRDRWTLHPGQLLILDEASLAGTLHLDRITTAAAAAGAKVLLVGDPMQLGAVDASGAFAMLAHDRDTAAELTDPRRFSQTWERDATLQLRAGDPHAIDTYTAHGRVHSGNYQDTLDQVLHAWSTDLASGLDTLMIAADHATVTDLNHRARAHLITTGTVTAEGVPIADGAAGLGDRIITRRNDRTLRYGHRDQNWVRNGDTWTVTNTGADGSLTAKNGTGAIVRLDPGYVAEHVELGYATTANLAQGRTVDTAHVVITSTTTREALYVAATRGRHTNTLNVVLDGDVDLEARQPPTASEVLARTLATSGADTSAHATQHALTIDPPRSAERWSATQHRIDRPSIGLLL